MLILHFCALKNGNLFPKTIPQSNSNRNAKITAIFELVDKPDLTSVTYLYNISHWQLRILTPPEDFRALKNCHWGVGGCLLPLAPAMA